MYKVTFEFQDFAAMTRFLSALPKVLNIINDLGSIFGVNHKRLSVPPFIIAHPKL